MKEIDGFMLSVTDQCFIAPIASRGRSCHPGHKTCIFKT